MKEVNSTEVSFWLNNYNDLFSDFDHRDYSQRAVSDDFLAEAKRFTREKKFGEMEVHFLLPAKMRDKKEERLITKRLHEHFRHHHQFLHSDLRHTRRQGMLLTGVGMLFMTGAALTTAYNIAALLRVILEPGGWFMTWMGLDLVFLIPHTKKAELEFYEKMSKGEIAFGSQ